MLSIRAIYTLSTAKRNNVMQKPHLFTATKINPYLLFFLLCVVLYLPSVFLRLPFYPDELRNIHIANSLKDARDYLFPKYFGEFYYDKPPLYFWILKALLLPKLPNVLFLPILFNLGLAWALASLNYLFLKKEGQPDIGTLSSLFLITTAIFYGMSILVRMDILFLLFIFLSVFFFRHSLLRRKLFFLVPSALFSFLAVFTKGAFGIILPLFIELGLGVITKDKKTILKALLVNSLTLALILLWTVSFSQINKNYFYEMFTKQTLNRGLNPQSHAESIFYYVPFLLPLFLPWSICGVMYFVHLKRRTRYVWEKMYLMWFIGGFIILSLVGSKLPMYLLLLAPALCGLIAVLCYEAAERTRRNLLIITSNFFIAAWLAGFIYFSTKGIAIPFPSFLILVLFVVLAIWMIGLKSFGKQLKTFFIVWVILLEVLNFAVLPLVSKSSDFHKVVAALKAQNTQVKKIYLTEKSLQLLKFYFPLTAIIYQSDRDSICQGNSFFLVSKKKDFPCSMELLGTIDDLLLFYKQ